ncbi:GNAT family N-acetyltransferase [uncultured Microbacterium sp.]|uniref:GNAT family N-acetyltransferase n=1 Tax=uncultured Microbacterium sp. TaxID=191216 RepID=UPI0026094DC4|nr:GNAT family protein [uncultured Microbacterium sp.]
MVFERDLGDGLTLALRTPVLAHTVHALAAANLDRLKLWEPWAHAFDPSGPDETWDRMQLQEYIDKTAIPTVVMRNGRPLGAVSARIDRYTGTGSIGYWLDAAAEGQGIAQRACRTLIDDMLSDGIARVEIRTAAHNARSIRLAERLGFEREGTLRSALPVGDERHDLAVYGLVA